MLREKLFEQVGLKINEKYSTKRTRKVLFGNIVYKFSISRADGSFVGSECEMHSAGRFAALQMRPDSPPLLESIFTNFFFLKKDSKA